MNYHQEYMQRKREAKARRQAEEEKDNPALARYRAQRHEQNISEAARMRSARYREEIKAERDIPDHYSR